MTSDHRIACWQGAVGVLTDNDPSAACTWNLDILANGFRGAGIEVPRVVAEALMGPGCDVFELGDAIRSYARAQGDEEELADIDLGWVEKMAVYLGATGWTLQYLCEVAELLEHCPYIGVDDLYMWAKAFRRDRGAVQAGSWTDGQVSDLITMYQMDVRGHLVIVESDILALGYLMGTMSDAQAATCRPLLERCLVKLAWVALDVDIFEETGRSERVYGALDARWWSPDAVLVGFKDALLATCFEKCAHVVTFPPDTNLGYGRHVEAVAEWMHGAASTCLPTKILSATHEELAKPERVMALRRAYSAACLQDILADILKALHRNNGSNGAFWVASQSTYDVMYVAWSKVLAERFFSMFHSVPISRYLPFMRQFKF